MEIDDEQVVWRRGVVDFKEEAMRPSTVGDGQEIAEKPLILRVAQRAEELVAILKVVAQPYEEAYHRVA